MDNSTKIAGDFTKRDWIKLRARLLQTIDTGDNWTEAVQLFRTRMEDLYLKPIGALINSPDTVSNGTAITLLETAFLENIIGFYYGIFLVNPDKNYNEELVKKADYFKIPTEELEFHSQPYFFSYYDCGMILTDFLMSAKPFSDVMNNERLVAEFFSGVCLSVQHEGMTKGGWKLRFNEDPANKSFIELKEKMDGTSWYAFYYNTFFDAIRDFVDIYSSALTDRFNSDMRMRFIRKFDDISNIKKVWFFSYGSNMYSKVLKKRIPNIYEYRICCLKNFRFRIDKRCEDGSVKANISYNPGTEVWGVCYLVDFNDFKILAEQFNKGYKYLDVAVRDIDGNLIIAKAFLSTFINSSARPDNDYLNCIINGAYEKALPLEYVWNVMDVYKGQK